MNNELIPINPKLMTFVDDFKNKADYYSELYDVKNLLQLEDEQLGLFLTYFTYYLAENDPAFQNVRDTANIPGLEAGKKIPILSWFIKLLEKYEKEDQWVIDYLQLEAADEKAEYLENKRKELEEKAGKELDDGTFYDQLRRIGYPTLIQNAANQIAAVHRRNLSKTPEERIEEVKTTTRRIKIIEE